MKFAIVIGTRPEIIKMSPLIRFCQSKQLDYFVIHSGQHYSYLLDKKFFDDLSLPEPKYSLNVGSHEFRIQIGYLFSRIYEVLVKEKPDLVFVQGDTNTVLGGALAAAKGKIAIGHLEAGLRSFDLSMQEELNRILTDRLSDYLFAPTAGAKANLLEEGTDSKKIFVTGNTVVDAVVQNLEISKKNSRILSTLALLPQKYILTTFHRAENVDDKSRLKGIISGLELTAEKTGLTVTCPLHPRTQNKIKEFGLRVPDNISVIEPLGYLDFLLLESSAAFIVTDSGGLQEEACILKVPCVTIRDNTERPETLGGGMNILAGTDPKKILESSKKMLGSMIEWQNLYGDGKATEKIFKSLGGKE